MSEDKKLDINSLDDEALEAVAKVKVDLEEKENYISEAHKFIIHFNVKKGDTRVPSFMIYMTYRKWKQSLGLEPEHKNTFLKGFAKLFDSKKDTYFKYYLLDPAPFNLSEEAYQEHREEMRNEKKKKRHEAHKYKKVIEKEKKDFEEKKDETQHGETRSTNTETK